MESEPDGKRVFDGYMRLHNAAERDTKWHDDELYDMEQRLKLAKKVVNDNGNRRVADLGSYYGGMSYALRACGAKPVSAEISAHRCRSIKNRGINDEVVRCDSFSLPLREMDALVSYMFLGLCIPEKPGQMRDLAGIFRELSKSAGTIYSVELKREYAGWFENGRTDKKAVILKADPGDPEIIGKRLEEALPDFEVEYLGEFGRYRETGTATDDRIGFKFTKKKKTGLKARILGWLKA